MPAIDHVDTAAAFINVPLRQDRHTMGTSDENGR